MSRTDFMVCKNTEEKPSKGSRVGTIACNNRLKTGDGAKEKKVIEVRDLIVERSGANIVEDVNFDVFKGNYVGMVGPNGGGKTTLLQALLGIIPIKTGTVRLFGQDIKGFTQWEKIAYLSQTAINFDNQFPLSVQELVSLGRLNRGRLAKPMSKNDRKIVNRTMEFMGITNLAKKRIGHLSGGQKQRVVLAKALVREPSIIILDEPVSGVDAATQERFYKRLSDLNIKKGITILMVSHDLTAVFCRMSHMICVNKYVRTCAITTSFDPTPMLKETYGEHFQFAFHRHNCEGAFYSE
ncbi:metal ABC transporter ATP-binding protein [[Eubacterium] cellulosolvens]